MIVLLFREEYKYKLSQLNKSYISIPENTYPNILFSIFTSFVKLILILLLVV